MRYAIVIGATSGIGRGLALRLALDGYRVGITGRREELLEVLKSEMPDSFCVSSFDVTDTKLVCKKLEQLVGELGGLDLLVLCAGTGDLNEGLDFEIEESTINTNIVGFTCVADWAFNYFRSHKVGHLVGITSIGGLRGSRHAASYNASKAYQINYLEGLRQLRTRLKLPIHITDIRPGLVDTAMAKGDGLFWVMPVEKAVAQIVDAIGRRKRVVYVTRRWRAIAILFKLLPAFLQERM